MGQKKKKPFKRYDKPKYLIPHVGTLDPAIICDLDGTLAWLNGRSPFAYQQCNTDLLNEAVFKILQQFWDTHKIFIITGRSEICRTETEEWLKRHGVKYHQLFMKPQGQERRKDVETKREIFEAHLRNRYNVDFALDDRNRVVEMWRQLGIICLQVADGNF